MVKINLDSLDLKQALSPKVFDSFESKLRRNDKIIVASHLNPTSNLLTLSMVNHSFNAVFDLTAGQLFWHLPNLGMGLPLCMTSDMDKLTMVYDSNKIALFDLINRRLH